MEPMNDYNREDRDKLIQILTEITALRTDVAELKAEQKITRADAIRLSLAESRLDTIEAKIKDMEEKYVTQAEYEPIRRVFWLVVGAVITIIVGAVIGVILVL